MKERPILFSAPMVRALLAGTKTVTRRLLKPRHDYFVEDGVPYFEPYVYAEPECPQVPSPYGDAGDRLWVREAFTWITGNGIRPWYRADGEPVGRDGRVLATEPGLRRWSPSIHMPRKVSRILLEIVNVRIERLLDITDEDAKREGVRPFFEALPNIGREQHITTGELAADAEYRAGFALLWDELNADRATWKSNPYVWRVEFKRVEQEARAT